MADAGPRQMIDQRRHTLAREHVHDFDARLHPLLGISIERDLHPRLLHQDHVASEVADDEQRLGARIDHEAGMADRVPRGVHRLHAGNDLLAVFVEHDAIPIGEEVLLGGKRRTFRGGAEPLSSVQNSRSACAMWVCAFGKLRLPSADMIPPTWSICAWVGMTWSMSLGSIPDCLRLVTSRPIASLRLTELIPVSNSASLSPVLITSAFWSSTTLSAGRKWSLIIWPSSSAVGPRKVREAGPIASGPSDTTVASMLPILKR